MTSEKNKVFQGELLDDELTLSLNDLSTTCNIQIEIIIEMVEHGVIEPSGLTPEEWYFTARAIIRSQTALRLQQDLGVNLPGAALALDLLDELEQLRERVRLLEQELLKA